MRRLLLLFLWLLFTLNLSANNILHIKIANAISPATSMYLNDAFFEAKKIDAKLMFIELDTPGGLVTTTREMVQKILNSHIPVVMYVSPKGSRAASAGTFLMYASHIAAMAPGTNIGAATPVNLMPQQPDKTSKKEQQEQKSESLEKTKNAMEKKVINDTVAYIKSLAELRGRNIDWAIEAVKEGKSLSANEALEKNVVDFVVNDVPTLLKSIDGKSVNVNGEEVIIDTKTYTLVLYEGTWKTNFLQHISNPNIAYMFLLLAMYGILFEMMNPGSIFPGVIGAVAALVALYALNILPFNYVGLLLIGLGIALMLAEVTVAGFGILGIGGVVAFAFGSLLLFDEETLGVGLSFPLVIAFSLVSFGFFSYLLSFLIRSRKEKSVVGISNLEGLSAKVISIDGYHYKVECNAEIWNANSDEKLNIGDEVIVEKVSGLNMKVRSTK